MNKPTSLIIGAIVILGLIVLFSATFVADETEQAKRTGLSYPHEVIFSNISKTILESKRQKEKFLAHPVSTGQARRDFQALSYDFILSPFLPAPDSVGTGAGRQRPRLFRDSGTGQSAGHPTQQSSRHSWEQQGGFSLGKQASSNLLRKNSWKLCLIAPGEIVEGKKLFGLFSPFSAG
jgi:hypothetical protein